MLRVATYNVRGLRDDRAALVRVIRAMRPDVLCLQEVPRFSGWRAKRRRLARDTGMTVAAGGRVGGVAVFAGPGVRVLHGRGARLRWFPGLEWRAVALAVVEKDGVRYAVCSAHLDLLPGARLRHATQIVPMLQRTARMFGARAVLAGDVNEQPGEPTWRYLADRFTDCFGCHAASSGAALADRREGGTFTATDPARRIDAIFAEAGLAVLTCGGAQAAAEDLRRASDHLPVVADIGPGHPVRSRPRIASGSES
ncbi:endonuclease/exonuclease/phosphatase family protein [Planotetraspora sp. A-T 1434]|uniref:endonuclease/exonuclease/phosphatase family protein n=1 Tax=Planotetraspora sp. A-T 1434 TaxID=2979219 RepID=UPI0021C093DB|nr:endonuclease/exonuclease/phosphatase family protein [Planotetraspora sp. A-T 1434]MCT9930138.1 endonuclease/exonuclease/phosphatase family protein [Planotetraspora sp. A-T 1434]